MDTTDEAARTFEALAYEKLTAVVMYYRGPWPDDMPAMVLKDFGRLSDKGIMPLTEIERTAAENAFRRVGGLVKIASAFERFALGWDEFKVRERLFEIGRFVAFHLVVPIDERRQLAGEARAVLKADDGIKRLDRAISRDLVDLAAQQPEFKGRGGNRRKGKHSVKAHVARMAVRLYLDAHEKPGFSGALCKTAMVRLTGVSAVAQRSASAPSFVRRV
jgi:hypothetical protein